MTKNIIDENKVEIIADEGKQLTNEKHSIISRTIYTLVSHQDDWFEITDEEAKAIKEEKAKKPKNKKCPKTGKRCLNKTEDCTETCDATADECMTCQESDKCIKKILGI